LSNGVSVLDNIETFDYGKFVHVMDNEGNKIELWEPVDTVFTAMGRKTTKKNKTECKIICKSYNNEIYTDPWR